LLFWFWLEFEGLKKTLAEVATKSGCKKDPNFVLGEWGEKDKGGHW